MFGRIANSSILRISYQIIKPRTMLTFSNCRDITMKSCRVAPSLFQSSWRLYSKEANLEGMVVEFHDVQKATSDGKVLIVDVREPEEVKEHGQIPNSVNIPLGTVASVLSTMSDVEFERTYKRPKPTEDTEIIFYCMIGKRSGMAQQNAFNLGYKNVKNYLGSWTDWASKTQ